MKVIIPSYQRSDILVNKTLKLLIKNDIKLSNIYVFVADDSEYQEYLAKLPNGINLVIGEKGMVNIRNFITNFFDDGEIYCSIDDDIEKFTFKNNKTLLEVLNDCENELITSPYQLIGFPPTYNEFFNKGIGFKSGLLLCIGCMFVCRNDKSITVSVMTEDYERTIKSYIKYGATLRCCNLMIKTKFFGDGGMNADGRSYEKYYSSIVNLYYRYSELILMKTKIIKYLSNEPIPHIRLSNRKVINNDVLLLPKISKAFFAPLLDILNRTCMTKIASTIDVKKIVDITKRPAKRRGFPQHRSETYGLVKRRPFLKERPNCIEVSCMSIKRPELHNELKRIGDIICPFKYSSIFINQNLVSPIHTDSNNVGKSLIVSIGEYEGCNLVIGGFEYNANYSPLIFDGSQIEHYNTELISGNKYSLIYYDITSTKN